MRQFEMPPLARGAIAITSAAAILAVSSACGEINSLAEPTPTASAAASKQPTGGEAGKDNAHLEPVCTRLDTEGNGTKRITLTATVKNMPEDPGLDFTLALPFDDEYRRQRWGNDVTVTMTDKEHHMGGVKTVVTFKEKVTGGSAFVAVQYPKPHGLAKAPCQDSYLNPRPHGKPDVKRGRK